MKERLQQLSRKALALIKSPDLNDPKIMARLGPIPAKLQRMELQFEELELEASEVEEFIESVSSAGRSGDGQSDNGAAGQADFAIVGRRGAQTKLRVEIDGEVLGRPGSTRVISEHKASKTLVRCLALLHEGRGIGVLEKLSNMRVNRGPFISKRPTVDYRNVSKPGELYHFQPISNSGYHVLTTNTTQEKADNLTKAAKYLGFTPGAIKVEVVEK